MTPELPRTRDEVRALLRSSALARPPRRFALYESVEDDAGWDGRVFAWGLGFEDHPVVRSMDERLHGRFTCEESLLRILGRRSDIGLLWIDAEQ
jgi:hypothetical protein